MNTTTDAAPDDLRTRMVDAIATARATSPQVEDAMRTVARHEFVPKASPEHAYADEAVITHRAADGTALSCASVPSLVAVMLDNLQVQPGNRILEIGAGKRGLQRRAARHPRRARRARHHHRHRPGRHRPGSRQPRTSRVPRRATSPPGDAGLGVPDNAPYDRLVVTIGSLDIPPCVVRPAQAGGRLVVPLRWRGQTQSVASRPGRGRPPALRQRLPVRLRPDDRAGRRTLRPHRPGRPRRLYWDADQPVDPATLLGALEQPKATVGSSVTVGPEDPFDGARLHLAATEPGTCRIAADPTAVETNLCTPAIPVRSPALIQGGSIAYMTLTRLDSADDEPRWELGAAGHGPLGNILSDPLSANRFVSGATTLSRTNRHCDSHRRNERPGPR